MVQIRRYLVVVIAIMSILLLTGCKKYYFNHNETPDDIKEIKIISVVYEDDQYKEETLVVIEDDLKQDFLDDLSKLEFSKYVIGDPMSVSSGTIIKLSFNDESYQLITHYWTDIYNIKGERSWISVNCSEDEFLDLVNKYLNEDI